MKCQSIENKRWLLRGFCVVNHPLPYFVAKHLLQDGLDINSIKHNEDFYYVRCERNEAEKNLEKNNEQFFYVKIKYDEGSRQFFSKYIKYYFPMGSQRYTLTGPKEDKSWHPPTPTPTDQLLTKNWTKKFALS